MSWLSDVTVGNSGNVVNAIKTNPFGTYMGAVRGASSGGTMGPGGSLTPSSSSQTAGPNPWAQQPGYATGSNGEQGGGGQAYAGAATTPGFTPNYDPSQALSPGYNAQVAGNDQGFNAYKAMALQQGPSSWANLATEQQAAEALSQLDKGAQSVAGANAGAQDALAAQGGLSSGARERIAEQGATNMTDMGQNVARQENLNNLQIGMNDQQNKIQELSQLPGLENQMNQNWEDVKQTDLANEIGENQSVNAYNQNLYNQQMQAWGAAQQANATANSGKKGFGK